MIRELIPTDFTLTICLGGLFTLLIYPLNKWRSNWLALIFFSIALCAIYLVISRYKLFGPIQPEQTWLYGAFFAFLALFFSVSKTFFYRLCYGIACFYWILFLPFLHLGLRMAWDALMPNTMYDTEIVLAQKKDSRFQLVNNRPLLSKTQEIQLVLNQNDTILTKKIYPLKDCDSLHYEELEHQLAIKVIHKYDTAILLDTLVVY